MKRYLVQSVGDNKRLFSTFVLAEVSRNGEVELHNVLRKAYGEPVGSAIVRKPDPDDDVHYTYRILQRASRKELDANSVDMQVIYLQDVQRYNEKQDGVV